MHYTATLSHIATVKSPFPKGGTQGDSLDCKFLSIKLTTRYGFPSYPSVSHKSNCMKYPDQGNSWCICQKTTPRYTPPSRLSSLLLKGWRNQEGKSGMVTLHSQPTRLKRGILPAFTTSYNLYSRFYQNFCRMSSKEWLTNSVSMKLGK